VVFSESKNDIPTTLSTDNPLTIVEKVVDLTNQFRVDNGLVPLSIDWDLQEAAQQHSQNMAILDFYDHTGLDGSRPSERALSKGYEASFVGENIGAGYVTPEDVVNGWMNSPGHRDNILNPSYNEIGVGYYFLENDTGNTNYNSYWTQKFGQGEIEDSNSSGSLFVTSEMYDLTDIKDFDGNSHGLSSFNSNINISGNYKFQGEADVQGNGSAEAVLTNHVTGRWATVEIDPITGTVDYSRHGANGSTRIVGLYIDPTLAEEPEKIGGPFDSQSRFQNDLLIDNLILQDADDYNGDGFQEMYWKTSDSTAYLRALMHGDGNIQYANYQTEEQMTDYLTSTGNEDAINVIL
jgi:hypothetical protein